MSNESNLEITTIEQINPAEVQLTHIEDPNKYFGNPTWEFEWRGFEGHLGRLGLLRVGQDDADFQFEGSVDGSERQITTRIRFGELFMVERAVLDIVDIEMLGWERPALAPPQKLHMNW